MDFVAKWMEMPFSGKWYVFASITAQYSQAEIL